MPAMLPRLASVSLDTARWQWRNGYITDAEWLAYLHAWQTGAPRFAIRACQCDECRTNYPSPEFTATF